MIQEIARAFDNAFVVCEPGPDDYVLSFRGDACLVRLARPGAADADADDFGDVIELPRLRDYPSRPDRTVYLFSVGGERFFLALEGASAAGAGAAGTGASDGAAPAAPALPGGFTFEAMGWLRHTEPAHLLFSAVTASQLNRWYRSNRFCGCCGHAMELGPRSRELVCPECAHIVYPRICPGVICAVTSCDEDGEKIVLTRYAGRTTALWALVAGYTEVGETLEDTVRREVMEEVGLRVRNLRFYKSQPWGFSDTLLAGFWCEVEGDPSITVDHSELKEARWFLREEIPLERTGDRASLTGEMIERFRLMGRAAWE